ncbi:hypothetical protein [Sporolactobacillus nakayamae]|uniref:Uncharacterized protein n=1 Tax=Sporolactobacillus nakayamae TaxID=269670 RepID=A0A1I2T5K8_9BACL|nr:hypothetical protein [Sporolactobacillus nakayamae]SFG57521.1 hypothetical protein SAMN02982927_02115 [Sporolactobacillus nakayamae]
MTIEEIKTYLDTSSTAIEAAKKSIYTESEIQEMIDTVCKELDPSWKKLGPYQKLIFGWSMSAPKMLMSQNYLDEVIKPFITKVNQSLNWNLRTPADFMK